jgi:hypothetical protein
MEEREHGLLRMSWMRSGSHVFRPIPEHTEDEYPWPVNLRYLGERKQSDAKCCMVERASGVCYSLHLWSNSIAIPEG